MSPPRVDFYILQGSMPMQAFVCRLVDKIWRLGEEIYIHAESKESAQDIDKLLWIFSDTSFLPHTLYDREKSMSAPIVIGWQDTEYDNKDVLVNLTTDIPGFVGEFARIVECVPEDGPQKQASRARFREYRARNFELHHHSISA